MDGIQEVDIVLQRVRQATRRFGIAADTMITQQILLFGNAFYGYRFTATDFAAIWSAVDKTIKVYDRNERLLEIFSSSETAEEISAELVIPLPTMQHRAA